MGTDAISNDYGGTDVNDNIVKVPPHAPLDFSDLTKLATNLSPQSSPPENAQVGWVYLDDGTNTDSGNKGFRLYSDNNSWEDLLGYTQDEIEGLVNALIEMGDKLVKDYDDDAGTLLLNTTALDEAEIDVLITEGEAISTSYDSDANTLTIGVQEIDGGDATT